MTNPLHVDAPGGGTLGIAGMQIPVIDLGAEGMPAQGCDLVLYPRGALAPVLASIGCPPGSMIALVPPERAALIRAQVKGQHMVPPPTPGDTGRRLLDNDGRIMPAR